MWPGIKKDCLQWARSCLPCQRSKIHRHNQLNPLKIDVPDNRFDHVHIDIVVMPLIRGYRYCLTMIDRFSRWPEAAPLKEISADAVATAFWSHWISRFGCPKIITTDQGSQFESALFKALANLIGTRHCRTTAYHPQANGLVERWHRSFKAALMCHSNEPWPDLLPTVLLGLRTCFKEDLRTTAAELVYGTNIRLPNEFFADEDAPPDPQVFIEKFREHMRMLRPTKVHHHAKKKMFLLKNINDCSHVLLRTDAVKEPLEPPYTGPYPVVKRFSDRVFTIKIGDKESNVSVERLKPVFIAKENDPENLPADRIKTNNNKKVTFAS